MKITAQNCSKASSFNHSSFSFGEPNHELSNTNLHFQSLDSTKIGPTQITQGCLQQQCQGDLRSSFDIEMQPLIHCPQAHVSTDASHHDKLAPHWLFIDDSSLTTSSRTDHYYQKFKALSRRAKQLTRAALPAVSENNIHQVINHPLMQKLIYTTSFACAYTSYIILMHKMDHCDNNNAYLCAWVSSLFQALLAKNRFDEKAHDGSFDKIYQRPFSERWFQKSRSGFGYLSSCIALSSAAFMTPILVNLTDSENKSEDCDISRLAKHSFLAPYLTGLGLIILGCLAAPMIERKVKADMMAKHENINQMMRQHQLNQLALSPEHPEHITMSESPEGYILEQILSKNQPNIFSQACQDGREDVVQFCLNQAFPYATAWCNEVSTILQQSFNSNSRTPYPDSTIEYASTPLKFKTQWNKPNSGGKNLLPIKKDILDAANQGQWHLVPMLYKVYSQNIISGQTPNQTAAQTLEEVLGLSIGSAPLSSVLALLTLSETIPDMKLTHQSRAITEGISHAAAAGHLEAILSTLNFLAESTPAPPQYQQLWSAAKTGDFGALTFLYNQPVAEGRLEEQQRVGLYLAASERNFELVNWMLLQPQTTNWLREDTIVGSEPKPKEKASIEFIVNAVARLIVQQKLSSRFIQNLCHDSEIENRLGSLKPIQIAIGKLKSNSYRLAHAMYHRSNLSILPFELQNRIGSFIASEHLNDKLEYDESTLKKLKLQQELRATWDQTR